MSSPRNLIIFKHFLFCLYSWTWRGGPRSHAFQSTEQHLRRVPAAGGQSLLAHRTLTMRRHPLTSCIKRAPLRKPHFRSATFLSQYTVLFLCSKATIFNVELPWSKVFFQPISYNQHTRTHSFSLSLLMAWVKRQVSSSTSNVRE